MSALILAVALAALLPIVFAGLAKRQGGYDNRAPRAWLAQLEGAQARAQAAQENSHEAFPPFAAAVILAVVLAPERVAEITTFAYAFLGLRLAYGPTSRTGTSCVPCCGSLPWPVPFESSGSPPAQFKERCYVL